jgi:histone H3/H4
MVKLEDKGSPFLDLNRSPKSMEEAIVGHLKLAIVRMLYSQGFTKSSTHTVAVLTDLLDRYLKLLLGSCADYAHHAGRPSVNAYDTLLAMEDMGTTLDNMRDYCDTEAKDTQKYTTTLPKSAQELAELKGMLNYFIFLYATAQSQPDYLQTGLRIDQPIAIPLKWQRAPTPDLDDIAGTMDSDASSPMPNTPIQYSLPPISSSPLDTSVDLLRKPPCIVPDAPEIPEFMPPFPVLIINPEDPVAEPPPPEPEPVPEDDSSPSIPADYKVPAPYELSKLQARGPWHLPRAPVPSSPNPDLTAATTEELFTALSSVKSESTLPTNPGRHKISMNFLGMTPGRYNTPDTLFAQARHPVLHPNAVYPTYVVPIAPNPKNPLPVPPSLSKPVGIHPPIAFATTSTTSRMSKVGQYLFSVSSRSASQIPLGSRYVAETCPATRQTSRTTACSGA